MLGNRVVDHQAACARIDLQPCVVVVQLHIQSEEPHIVRVAAHHPHKRDLRRSRLRNQAARLVRLLLLLLHRGQIVFQTRQIVRIVSRIGCQVSLQLCNATAQRKCRQPLPPHRRALWIERVRGRKRLRRTCIVRAQPRQPRAQQMHPRIADIRLRGLHHVLTSQPRLTLAILDLTQRRKQWRRVCILRNRRRHKRVRFSHLLLAKQHLRQARN